MSISLALVAPGAMGAALGARLTARGARVLTTLQGRSDRTCARALQAGMEDASPQALLQAPWFLSVVPPADALTLARQFAQWCEGIEDKPVYVDLNAINPDTAGRVQAIVEAAGARFVDGCIIGLPPQGDAAGPALYLSDDAVEIADALNACGLDTRLLHGGVGAASALKMAYAGLNKGMGALGVAMILAADRHGAGEALRDALADSNPALLGLLERGLPDLLPKARRWAPEMQQIGDFIGGDRPESRIFSAMADQYRALADDVDGGAEEADVLKRFAASRSL